MAHGVEAVLPLELRSKHIFFPLSMFPLQLRISLRTVHPTAQKRPEDLREMFC